MTAFERKEIWKEVSELNADERMETFKYKKQC
jgi:hypothetical protein